MGAECQEVDDSGVPSPGITVLAFAIVCAIVFPLVLGMGMSRGLNHDEHQHIAAGALIAREGLVPYRDFPHFHTPYLSYAYAALFRSTDQLLNSARLLSAVCATAILGVIGAFGYVLFRKRGRRTAWMVSGGSVVLAVTTMLFTQTAGRAWNHEPSLLLVLLAFVAQINGIRTGHVGWFGAGGILLGLAIGTRITCAPLVAPFGLVALLHSRPRRLGWAEAFSLSGGLLVGLAGLVCLFAIVPEQALFDNFGFAKANIAYRFSEGAPRTMTLPTKLRFFFKEIIRPDIALFLAGLLPTTVAYLIKRGSGRRLPSALPFLLLLLPFVMIGALAPSPAFDQYFLPLVPLLLIMALYGLSSIPSASIWSRRMMYAGLAMVLLSVGMGVRGFEDVGDYFNPSKWEGTRLNRRAQELLTHVTHGRILTLAPIYPLEAGLAIYPAFSTGPFAWRVSPYVEADKAVRIGIVSPAMLGKLLEASPPAGVLVGLRGG
jgi:drug/metabolite transporter superfamily protein YnfA